MSNQSSNKSHWEAHSSSSTTVKMGDKPAVISGKQAEADGTFDVRKLFLIKTIVIF